MMGIVNVTPDSFYDKGMTATSDRAIARGLELAAAGAGIVDVGGMTAQPGRVLSVDEEIARVEPVVRALRAALDIPISIDTYRAGVADAALAAGADLVNDHTGLSDPAMAATIARHGAGLVVTHIGLAPKQVQTGRHATSVEDIARFLEERAAAARAAVSAQTRSWSTPGSGSARTPRPTCETLRELRGWPRLGYPLLLRLHTRRSWRSRWACRSRRSRAPPPWSRRGLPRRGRAARARPAVDAPSRRWAGWCGRRRRPSRRLQRLACSASRSSSSRRALKPRVQVFRRR